MLNYYTAVHKVYSTLMTEISALVSHGRGNVYSQTKRQEGGQVVAEIQTRTGPSFQPELGQNHLKTSGLDSDYLIFFPALVAPIRTVI